MHQNTGRVLRQRLIETCYLLVDVIFRCARIGCLAAQLLARLLEHFINGKPVFNARNHDVHDVFFTRLAAERIFRFRACRRCKECGRKDRHGGRAQKSAQVSSSRPKPLPLVCGALNGRRCSL